MAPSISAQITDYNSFVRNLPFEDYLFYSLACLALILFAGCMSGLNVGLMSIDLKELDSKILNGNDYERAAAKRLYSVVKHHHLLLVSILLWNALAMEALPIMFNMMFSEVLSVIVSVSFVLIVSEIIPQAVLTGPRQLFIANSMLPLVWVVIILSFPICYPLSKLLDYFLGAKAQNHDFTAEDMKMLVRSKATLQTNGCDLLTIQQVSIIDSVIDLSNLRINYLARPLKTSQCIYFQHNITHDLLTSIKDSKLTHLPVVDKVTLKVRAVLSVEELLGVGFGTRIEDLKMAAAEWVDPSLTLLDALGVFSKTQARLLFVYVEPDVASMMTLEALQNFLYKLEIPIVDCFDFRINPVLMQAGDGEQLKHRPSDSQNPSLLSTSYSDEVVFK